MASLMASPPTLGYKAKSIPFQLKFFQRQIHHYFHCFTSPFYSYSSAAQLIRKDAVVRQLHHSHTLFVVRTTTLQQQTSTPLPYSHQRFYTTSKERNPSPFDPSPDISSSDTYQPLTMADLPTLPVPHAELARYISENADKPMTEIIEPYRNYEASLRTVYAQDRKNPILQDPHLNVLPLFTQDTKLIKTRARDLAAESEEEKSKYVMPLPDDKRRPHGSPATVADLSEFQNNFNVFSESSLVDVDWNNVVAAGSSVVNCLLPVPKEFNTTKRKLREYYHEKFCPASDVDLFLYGLTQEEAIEKIKQIERAIRDALLNEVTVVRTKYAITIASQYPVRHVQVSPYHTQNGRNTANLSRLSCVYTSPSVKFSPVSISTLLVERMTESKSMSPLEPLEASSHRSTRLISLDAVLHMRTVSPSILIATLRFTGLTWIDLELTQPSLSEVFRERWV